MADEKATLPRYTVGILTVSDSVSSGAARDQSGPALRECIEKGGNGATWTVTVQKTVGDDAGDISASVKQWAKNDRVDLIVTTGGTGFGIRDVTPEAVAPILDRQASGLVVAMLVASLTITPFAALARPVAGTIGRTLLITLPGSPKGSVENLMAVWKALPHALELNRGSYGKELHAEMNGLRPSFAAGPAFLGFAELSAGGNQSSHRCSHRAHADGAATGSSTGLSNDLGVPVAKRRRTSPYPLIDVEDAMLIISRQSPRLDVRELPVDEGLIGFVLAEDVVALEAVPGYRASVVDGYAIIGSDGPGVYDVISATAAGEQTNVQTDVSPFCEEQVTYATIDAPIPPGANTVVMAKGTDVKPFRQITEETSETEVAGLLNKLTLNTIERLAPRIIERINSFESEEANRLSATVVQLILRNVTDEPAFSIAYALLCREMLEKFSTTIDPILQKDGKLVTGGRVFRRFLLDRCQDAFTKGPRRPGLVSFLGELFKVQMLSARIMLQCIGELLKTPGEEEMESLCKLLMAIGESLDRMCGSVLRTHFDVMNYLVVNGDLPPRIRYMMEYVIELRKNRWVWHEDASGPMQLDHVQEERPKLARVAGVTETLEKAQSSRRKCAPGIGEQKLGDSSAAGAKHAGVPPLRPGQIARVSTGAPVPPGATAVVMVEDTKLVQASDDGSVEKRVEITVSVRHGENVREIGVDSAVGEVVLRKGELFTAVGGEHAALASVGAIKVLVYRKPVVAILSSGSEIVDARCPRELLYGQVRDCNRVALRAAIAGAGFEALDCGIVEDSADKLEGAIVTALARADVLITTGGVSMGEKDFLKSIIERSLKGTVHFGRVNMKPGKPTTFATLNLPILTAASPNPQDVDRPGQKLMFALPGNPASALVTFHLFVLPALRQMAGYLRPSLPVLKAQLAHPIRLDSRPEYHRAVLVLEAAVRSDSTPNVADNRIIAYSTGAQQSSRMLSLRAANGLLKLPPREAGSGELPAGSVVEAILIGDFP